jgi:cyclohexyl-isocyanide hydratase
VDRRTFARRAGAAFIALHAGSTVVAEPVDPLRSLRDKQLDIGMLIFPRMDQIDFTGPFAVLSRLPDSAIHVMACEPGPIKGHKGLILTPEKTLAEAPRLDVLHIPGGPGQEAMMEDERVLSLIRTHAASGGVVFSVCTGALLCGAAGILRGRRATTHWAAFDLLRYFGGTPVDARVVVDGNVVSAAGVTAGIDGALRLAALLRGRQIAQEIQLDIQYAPEPPFDAGSPQHAPRAVLAAVTTKYQSLTDARRHTARKVATRLGLPAS